MSEPYDHTRWDGSSESGEVELDEARENVFEGWPSSEDVVGRAQAIEPGTSQFGSVEPQPTEIHPALALEQEAAEPEPGPEPEPEPMGEVSVEPPEPEPAEPEPEAEPGPVALVAPPAVAHEHVPGELAIPPGYGVLEGEPDGTRRAVAVVVARFNGDITSRLLASALTELERSGATREGITVMPVPGAFELPIGAMALARTRRFACIVALGCVIRGDTPHFDYVASEAASGLQLAALETGVPVAFGVLTLEHADQAEPRIEKGAEAVRTALEMADLFSHLRAAAAR